MAELFQIEWLAAAGTPHLPAPTLMRWCMAIGWALVFACLGAALTRRFPKRTRHTIAMALAAWAAWDNPASPGHWLGLAFQSPSLSGMLLLVVAYFRMLSPEPLSPNEPKPHQTAVVAMGVVVGCVLLLDLLAVWPGSVYAWGFGPAALVVALAVSLWPAVAGGFSVSRHRPEVWVAPAVLLLFAVTRLPTGNMWDALIDPWLWLLLLVALLRAAFRRRRAV